MCVRHVSIHAYSIYIHQKNTVDTYVDTSLKIYDESWIPGPNFAKAAEKPCGV